MNVLEFTALVGFGSFLAGLLGSLTGLGGGVVLVPLLTIFFKVDIRYAIGASLVSVIATSSGAAAAYVRGGFSNIRIGMFLEIATTLGALSGAFLAVSVLLGLGSGAWKVLAMDQAMRIPFKVSTTTSNFMIGVTAAASAGVYLHRGYIDPGLSMPVMLGVLAGSLLGSRILVKAETKSLRLVFSVVILVLGLQMLYKGFTGGI